MPDPANPQSFNRYAYVLNSPLNLVDPTGHYSCNISFKESGVCVDAILPTKKEREPIWSQPFIDNPDWVQYYGHTEYSEGNYNSTNAGQHPGLDYGRFAEDFGGAWNSRTKTYDFDGTYGTSERPLISVYAGCYCNVHSTSTSSYAPGRVDLTVEGYPDFLLIYGHLQDIQVMSGAVTPDTTIGYLDVTERHVHLEIRRRSDNYFVNPFPYLSLDLQAQLLAFQGNTSGTRYQIGFPSNPGRQPNGFYIR